MTDDEKIEKFMDLSEDPYKISDEEILMEGEEQKETEQIEKDDEKIDELMMFQEFSEEKIPPKYDSVEEKYEEELMMEQVMEIVDRQLSQRNWADLDEEEERLSKRP
jgi:hypothetical protein